MSGFRRPSAAAGTAQHGSTTTRLVPEVVEAPAAPASTPASIEARCVIERTGRRRMSDRVVRLLAGAGAG